MIEAPPPPYVVFCTTAPEALAERSAAELQSSGLVVKRQPGNDCTPSGDASPHYWVVLDSKVRWWSCGKAGANCELEEVLSAKGRLERNTALVHVCEQLRARGPCKHF